MSTPRGLGVGRAAWQIQGSYPESRERTCGRQKPHPLELVFASWAGRSYTLTVLSRGFDVGNPILRRGIGGSERRAACPRSQRLHEADPQCAWVQPAL